MKLSCVCVATQDHYADGIDIFVILCPGVPELRLFKIIIYPFKRTTFHHFEWSEWNSLHRLSMQCKCARHFFCEAHLFFYSM